MTAKVMAASGMWLQSRSIALSGHAPRLTVRWLSPPVTSAPMRAAASMKRISPWMDCKPTPLMRTPSVLPRHPTPQSSWPKRHRLPHGSCQVIGNDCHRNGESLPLVALNVHAGNCASNFSVISIYGFGDQLTHHINHHIIFGSQRQRQQTKPVKNWLDTSPRTGIGSFKFSVCGAPSPSRKGVARLAEVGHDAAERARHRPESPIDVRACGDTRHLKAAALRAGHQGKCRGERAHRGTRVT